MPMQLQIAKASGEEQSLDPPWGYRPMAWIGLVLSCVAIPLALQLILLDPRWRVANIAVGAGGVLPIAVLGIIGFIALLRWLHWGQILAIVALSLSLGLSLPYTIVRLVMVEPGRLVLAVFAPLAWAVNVAMLVFWCRPSIRAYLR
ncbi:MAG: Hepatitis C virus core protein [Cyanobacteriota bacterium]|nr:Hepatitis C virus core protein [Cyanobacteriota bacterium]